MTTTGRARAVVRRLRLQRPARLILSGLRRVGAAIRVVRREAVPQGRAGASAIAALPSRLGLLLGYRRLLTRRIRFDLEVGTPDAEGLAVVVCLWNRPERLPEILRILQGQQTRRGVNLVLWNNQPAHSAGYRATIAASGVEVQGGIGALRSIRYFDSPTNIGGMGRFVAIRELVRRGYTGSYIMLDDDQNVRPGFIEVLSAAAAPRSVAGVWAWHNDGAYWNRQFAESTGESVDHVGTGGSVCDSAIVTDSRFFTRIPLRFLFMEDIWMSHYAKRNGWRLSKIDTPVEFVLSELDQGHAIFDEKERFFSWLRIPGHVPLRA